MAKEDVNKNKEVTSETSAIWGNHVSLPNTPDGFTLRTTFPSNPNGVEVMLERWVAGSEEPPHSHPGDDMTVVIEGKCRFSSSLKNRVNLFLIKIVSS